MGRTSVEERRVTEMSVQSGDPSGQIPILGCERTRWKGQIRN